MEFIHQAKLMRHHKCIFECVKSIGANCYSWGKKMPCVLDSLVFESGTS